MKSKDLYKYSQLPIPMEIHVSTEYAKPIQPKPKRYKYPFIVTLKQARKNMSRKLGKGKT